MVQVELENAGTIPWRADIFLAYHWLDDRDNPIVWDGERTPVPRLAPGEAAAVDARVRGPMPPGPYRLAFDMVAERRAWFSELRRPMLSLALGVAPRAAERRRGRDDEVHDVREPWRVAEPERVADGVDRRCERVPPAQRVQERVVALYALRQLREAPEDRRQEEPRQQGGRDQVLHVAVED